MFPIPDLATICGIKKLKHQRELKGAKRWPLGQQTSNWAPLIQRGGPWAMQTNPIGTSLQLDQKSPNWNAQTRHRVSKQVWAHVNHVVCLPNYNKRKQSMSTIILNAYVIKRNKNINSKHFFRKTFQTIKCRSQKDNIIRIEGAKPRL